MDINRHWRGDVGPIRVRVPREHRLVHRPAVALLPGGLHAMVRSRSLMIGCAGRLVAEVVRGAGNQVEVVTSNAEAPLARVPFDDAVRIVSASDSYVRVWGARDGTQGIWSITADGARLVYPFPRNHSYLRTRLGDVPVSEPVGGMVQGVFGEALVHVAEGTSFVFGASGALEAAVMPMGEGARMRWAYAKFIMPTAARSNELVTVNGERSIVPLPFVGARLVPFSLDGRMLYVVRRREGDALYDLGEEHPLTDRNGEGGFDALWSAPGNARVAMLRRTRGSARRLEVGDSATGWTTVHEGHFLKMGDDDFRWSPSGREFVARVRPVDSDGNQVEQQLLVTRHGVRALPRNMMVAEATVDDLGRVAYVRVEENGLRRLVVGGNASDALPYVWNVSFVGSEAAANVLHRGAIHRIELPYGR